MSKQDIRYNLSSWGNYAYLHASVTTSFQLAVYREACQYLQGDVIDCGCGSAKIAPFLADNKQVSSYTGIDFSIKMVEVARWLLQKLQRESFTIEYNRIEDLEGKDGYFASGVSIQSYYSWSEPLYVLSHIYRMLAIDGIFVLATVNQLLNLEKLSVEAEKELIAHPNFEAFKQYNIQLASNVKANFVSMNDLIQHVQAVGFVVEKYHQNHFLGGLNFLVLKKC